MSKTYILLAAILLYTASFAQYTFTSSTSNVYQALANPISLNNGLVWDQNSTFPISFFNFNIGGLGYSNLEVEVVVEFHLVKIQNRLVSLTIQIQGIC